MNSTERRHARNACWVSSVIGGRAAAKDQDRTAKPVALKKGVNMLVAAVINGSGPTQGCARVVDKANQPLKVRSGAEAPKQ